MKSPLNLQQNPKSKKLFLWFTDLMRAIYLFFPGIIFIVIYYFIIVALPLGQDLLMQTGEDFGPFAWTIVSMILWTIVAWFSSRMLADLQKDICYPSIYTHLPRLLGYNVSVGLQLAIFCLPTFFNPTTLQFWLFIVLQNVFYFMLMKSFERKGRIRIVTLTIAFIYALLLLVLLFFKIYSHHPKHTILLSLMGVLFFLLQLVFTWLVYIRRNWIDRNELSPQTSKKSFRGYQFLALIATGLYICIVFSTWFAFRFGALGCALLAFCILVGFIYMVRHAGRKINLRFGLLVLLVAIIVGFWGDPYEVELVKDSRSEVFKNRPPLDTFLARWISYREAEIRKGNFITYLVIADGGASRSGYWVSSVLSKLEEYEKPGATKEDRFSYHLLSLAGASGGSVGNAVFYALLDSTLRKENLKTPENKLTKESLYTRESTNFFDYDFLTYSLARFLVPDLFRHLFPINIDDRSAALATSMENSDSEAMNILLKRNLSSYFDTTGQRPMLLINTTNLQTGRPGEVSSIKIDTSFSGRIDVLTELDKWGKEDKDSSKRNLHLSTAVLLGARFPFLSPAGRIGKYYFNDGGYFDNTGAGITCEILDHIEGCLRDSSYRNTYPFSLLDSMIFKVICISNGSLEEKRIRPVHPLLNDLTAPILTIMNTRGEQTELVNERLKNFLKKFDLSGQRGYDSLNLPFNQYDKVSYPMNWVISDYNLERMRKNLERVDPATVLRAPERSATKK